MEAMRSSETSVLTRATRRQDGILHSHRRGNLKSNAAVTWIHIPSNGISLQRYGWISEPHPFVVSKLSLRDCPRKSNRARYNVEVEYSETLTTHQLKLSSNTTGHESTNIVPRHAVPTCSSSLISPEMFSTPNPSFSQFLPISYSGKLGNFSIFTTSHKRLH
jgi:hypothetical protein